VTEVGGGWGTNQRENYKGGGEKSDGGSFHRRKNEGKAKTVKKLLSQSLGNASVGEEVTDFKPRWVPVRGTGKAKLKRLREPEL